MDLVGYNIPDLHSLSPEWVQKIYAKESLNVHNVEVWQYGLWSFQTGGTKLDRFLPKNQHPQRRN